MIIYFTIISKKSLKEKLLLYIIVALKAEAQSFVERYRLQKSKIDNFILFTNDNIKLIISGMGVENARNATQALINNFDITDEDIYLNIGICGASKSYEIGELLEIGTISYNEINYTLDTTKECIVCVDKPISQDIYKLVDMESYGFYDAIKHNPAIKTSHIFKIVSDHFEPEKVTKEHAKMLIFNKIDDINTLIFSKD